MSQQKLFSTKELYLVEHYPNGKSAKLSKTPMHRRRKTTHENMHLMDGMSFTTNMRYPQLEAYNGPTDFDYVSYSERKKHEGQGEALHFFTDDYRFRDAVWYNLEQTTYSISDFDCLLTPDLSLWRDTPTDWYNKMNTFRTRFIGAYWQHCGFDVIPTASWGDLNSFTYCFEGLPMHSVIAVSEMGCRKNSRAFNRWCNGLRRLEASKSPTLIIIYGDEVKVDGLHTPLQFVQSYIHKNLRRL